MVVAPSVGGVGGAMVVVRVARMQSDDGGCTFVYCGGGMVAIGMLGDFDYYRGHRHHNSQSSQCRRGGGGGGGGA